MRVHAWGSVEGLSVDFVQWLNRTKIVHLAPFTILEVAGTQSVNYTDELYKFKWKKEAQCI